MAEKKVKVYFKGDRYMPELKHRVFGTFPLHEDGYFELPKRYADIVLMNTPKMFSLKASSKKAGAFTGAEYTNMNYDELQKYAKTRGVKNVFGVKKDEIIKSLLSMDKEGRKPPEPEKPKKAKPVIEQV